MWFTSYPGHREIKLRRKQYCPSLQRTQINVYYSRVVRQIPQEKMAEVTKPKSLTSKTQDNNKRTEEKDPKLVSC